MGLIEGKHRQIVAAAEAEFRERGFAGASMDKVASRAGVSKRTVYNHFESKEALFSAILDRMADTVEEAVAVTYRSDLPIRDQLLRMAEGEGSLMTNPDFIGLARMVMSETLRNPNLAAEKMARMARPGVFGRFFQAATDDGALRIDDIDRAVQQFLGLIKSQAFYPYIHSTGVISEAEMAKVGETSVDMFLKEYGAG